MGRPREFDEEQVLDAVMQTFWRNGYGGTSAQDLVEATGLGRGSLYAAYDNKHGLFEQALLRYRRNAQGYVDHLRQEGSPKELLRALMIDIVDSDLKAAERRGCLATNSAIELGGCDPRIADLVRDNFSILTRGIEETIRRGQVAGEISADEDAGALAPFVFNAIQGLRVLAKSAEQSERRKLVAIIDQTLAAIP